MAIIKADGDKLISYGEEIVSLSNQYISQINNLYKSLDKLNKLGWSGRAAEKYVATLGMEKQNFLNFGEYLKMYGNVVKNTGTNINYIISKWDDK